MEIDLTVEVAGLKLRNPVMLASGILGLSGYSMLRVAEAGAGAIVTKSICLNARDGYPNPTIVEAEVGLLNAMGLPNPSVREFLKEIKVVKQAQVPVVISVFGFSIDEYIEVAKIAGEEADAIELNLSCPHVEKTGLELGSDPSIVNEIVGRVKAELKVPIFAKLSSNVADIAEIARAAERAGADVIVAINTVRAMAIDVETQRPILANRIGGLSGPAIKPIALRCVYEIYEAVKIPIVGCGGIVTWCDAVEFILAGSSCIQVGTGIMYRGLSIFKEITEGIQDYLAKKGYNSVRDIVGLTHER